MEGRIEELRRRAGQLQRGLRTRYPRDVRDEAISLTKALRAKGKTLTAIEDLLGIRWQTLARWQRASKAKSRKRAVRPIPVVTTSQPSHALCVTTPSGVRVEGLDIKQVIEILQAGV